MKDNEPMRGKWRHSLKTVLVAGTGMCVHIPFRLNPIASLAWLGKQLPCPLHSELLVTEAEPLDTGADTHKPPIPAQVCRTLEVELCTESANIGTVKN